MSIFGALSFSAVYAEGGAFSLPSDGSESTVLSISLDAGTYRISAGAYADPGISYTISGYDSLVFPASAPNFGLPTWPGGSAGENTNILDVGIFTLTSAGSINLVGSLSGGGGGSNTVLIATPVISV